MEILSRKNEKIKNIKLLNYKKYRDKLKKYYLEGVKVVNEVLDLNIPYDTILYSEEILNNVNNGCELLERIHSLSNTISTSKDTFEFVSDTKTPQGIIIVIPIKDKSLEDLNFNNNILMLDKVADSGNVGTLIRTSVAFGVKDIICVKGTTDVYSPKVLRSTMSNIFKVNIVYIDNIEECFKLLKVKKYNIVTTSLNAKENSLDNIIPKKNVIILGNEANGVSKKVIDYSDELIKIPMETSCESLNVAIAGGIVLYKLYNK